MREHENRNFARVFFELEDIQIKLGGKNNFISRNKTCKTFMNMEPVSLTILTCLEFFCNLPTHISEGQRLAVCGLQQNEV